MTATDDRAGAPIEAQQFITDSTYNPQQVKALGEAFEGAWKRIAPGVGARPESVEAARLKLAATILSLAHGQPINSEQLKEAALKKMFAGPIRL
jgi:orotidine-5'-phosphate decarboxylase